MKHGVWKQDISSTRSPIVWMSEIYFYDSKNLNFSPLSTVSEVQPAST